MNLKEIMYFILLIIVLASLITMLCFSIYYTYKLDKQLKDLKIKKLILEIKVLENNLNIELDKKCNIL